MSARGACAVVVALALALALPSEARAFGATTRSVTEVPPLPVVLPRAAIAFSPRPYVISGLQGDFRVVDKAIIGPLRPHGVRVALLVTNGPDNALKARLLVVDLGPDSGKVIQTVFEQPTDPFGLAKGRVTAADIDHDGHKELFVCGGKPEQTSAYRLVRGKYEAMRIPFPRLNDTKLVWLDYNGDGWVDLFLSGSYELRDDVYAPVGDLFRNDHGRLVFERQILRHDYAASSAEAVDLDGDGTSDLVVFPISGQPHSRPLPTLLFLSRGGQLVAEPNPFMGLDDMLGLDHGHVASADINGDGKREVLMSGLLDYDLGVDTAQSISYQRWPSRGEDLYYQYDSDQVPSIYGAWTLADLNGDGRPDAFGWGGPNIRENLVCLYNDEGHLVPLKYDQWCQGFPDGLVATEVLPYDLDGDGRLDFLLLDGLTGDATVPGEWAMILLHNVSGRTH